MSSRERTHGPELVADRFYRSWATGKSLCEFRVTVAQTDLQVFADRPLVAETEASVRRVRADIERYAAAHAGFIESFVSLEPAPDAPEAVRRMCEATAFFGVGPMASVAGAVADLVGRDLLELSGQVIVENGGDIFFHTSEPPIFGLYAGRMSPFTGRVRFTPRGLRTGGVCTSSATVGPSVSLGRADAVVVVANSAALADAAATAVGNAVREPGDVQRAIAAEQDRGLVQGLLIAIGKTLGAWGAIEMVEGEKNKE